MLAIQIHQSSRDVPPLSGKYVCRKSVVYRGFCTTRGFAHPLVSWNLSPADEGDDYAVIVPTLQ